MDLATQIYRQILSSKDLRSDVSAIALGPHDVHNLVCECEARMNFVVNKPGVPTDFTFAGMKIIEWPEIPRGSMLFLDRLGNVVGILNLEEAQHGKD